ncbi:MAG: nucleotidyltransferase family protein [Chitinophagaceae bacterium]
MKAMLLAAGLGTRLKPFTDYHPKALAIVNGKSLLQRNIEYLQQFGITEIVVNVHHFAGQIIDAVTANNGWGSTVTISDETDAVLETGGGLQKAMHLLQSESDFVLMNADMLTNLNLTAMIAAHKKQQPLATLAVTKRTSSRVFLFDTQLILCGWRNTVTGEEKLPRTAATYMPLAFSGVHIINSAIFSLLKPGKYSMVDVYLAHAATHTIQGFDHTGDILLDVGKPDALAKAATLFA